MMVHGSDGLCEFHRQVCNMLQYTLLLRLECGWPSDGREGGRIDGRVGGPSGWWADGQVGGRECGQGMKDATR